jgi:hypothetical protein
VSFVGESKKIVEAMSVWMKLSSASEMPLTDQTGGVSVVLQELREGDFLERKTELRTFVFPAGGIVFVAEASGNPACEESCTGWAAIGSGDVGLGAAHAIFCDGIDVGSGDVCPRILTGQLTVAEIVGKNDDEIGRRPSKREKCY